MALATQSWAQLLCARDLRQGSVLLVGETLVLGFLLSCTLGFLCLNAACTHTYSLLLLLLHLTLNYTKLQYHLQNT